MKKINFLTIVLVLAVAGMISSLMISCNSTPKKNIGLQLYSIRDSINRDVPAAIEKVARWDIHLLNRQATEMENFMIWNLSLSKHSVKITECLF